MFSSEPLVSPGSDSYIYTPTQTAKRLFFYPVCTGCFEYLPGYSLTRSQYDSFLIMSVTEGTCIVRTKDTEIEAHAGDIVLLDCYSKHSYSTVSGWKSYWLHFDGLQSRDYYTYIKQRNGIVFHTADFHIITDSIKKIYHLFRNNHAICEAAISLEITSILTRLTFCAQKETGTAVSSQQSLSYITAYIHEHFGEPISLNQLAAMSSLSPYYFSRLFTKTIGQTPHQYIISVRIDSAKFLLKTTTLSIKEIGFRCGFSSESSFNTTFRKKCGYSPGQYRNLL